ncbi:MAG: sulfotransferase domain-containing protein, partial [Caulobacteraceae bacterium]
EASLAAQGGRRCLKTHLPLDALVFSPRAKYLYVGRDARDVVWSAYNHQAGFTDQGLGWINAEEGDWPRLTRPSLDVRDYYLRFVDQDELFGGGFEGVDFWDHIQGWWDARHLPNVKLLHFNNLKSNLEGQVRKIARFIEVEIDEAILPAIVEHCSFDYMRNDAARDESMKIAWKDGARTFFHKGTNGRWKDVLSKDEIDRCDALAARRLSPDCARWLASGEGAD